MKVLLIEDDEFKATQILNILRDEHGIEVKDKACSVTSAKRMLSGEAYDLVIVDMSLPTFDIGPNESGGRPQSFGGKEVIRYIDRREMPAKAIVITQFERFGEGEHQETIESLRAEILSKYPNIVRAVLYFDFGKSWKEELAKAMVGIEGK